MISKEKKEEFEKNPPHIYEKSCIFFEGVDGYDVYNCSAPFFYDGKKCIIGRVEKRESWSDSRCVLFEELSCDHFKAIPESTIYPLEDPSLCYHNGEWLLSGVSVLKNMGKLESYATNFYRGKDMMHPEYYTTGPKFMKDIRMVSLGDKIGVFTRPGDKIGFTIISDIDELTNDVLNNAPIVDLIPEDGHGGVNQAILLDSELIAIIGHNSYSYPKGVDWYSQHHVYYATASVFDPKSNKVLMQKIIATRSCFVDGTPIKMLPSGIGECDIVFPSGVMMYSGGKLNLYAGISDACMQRIVIDNPFEKFGSLVL